MAECKYIALSHKLEKYIAENDLHGRLPGTAKLAAILGANHITLRKVVKLLAESNKLSVIPNEGTFIVEQKEKRKKYHVLGFVGFPLPEEQAEDLFEHLNERLAKGSYRAINIAGRSSLFAERPELLLEFPVDGFAFFGSNITRKIAEKLLEENLVAVCSINSNFPEFDHVGMDYKEGYRKGIALLQEKGYRKIAFLDLKRREEFQNYIADIHGIFQEKLQEDFDEDMFRIYDPFAFQEKFLGRYRTTMVEDALSVWRKNMPDAVITSGHFASIFKKLNRDIVVLEFASRRQYEESCADITFCEDLPRLLTESTKLLLERLTGKNNRKEKKEIKIPFIIKSRIK